MLNHRDLIDKNKIAPIVGYGFSCINDIKDRLGLPIDDNYWIYTSSGFPYFSTVSMCWKYEFPNNPRYSVSFDKELTKMIICKSYTKKEVFEYPKSLSDFFENVKNYLDK